MPPTAGRQGPRGAQPRRGHAASLGGRQRRPVGQARHRPLGRRGAGGTSLGDYASERGTSIFTVEPPVNRNIADYGKGGNNAGEKVNQADRTTELQAYADAVRTVLLAN